MDVIDKELLDQLIDHSFFLSNEYTPLLFKDVSHRRLEETMYAHLQKLLKYQYRTQKVTYTNTYNIKN